MNNAIEQLLHSHRAEILAQILSALHAGIEPHDTVVGVFDSGTRVGADAKPLVMVADRAALRLATDRDALHLAGDARKTRVGDPEDINVRAAALLNQRFAKELARPAQRGRVTILALAGEAAETATIPVPGYLSSH